MPSPTARSLGYLRSLGYVVAVVEHWNHFSKRRQDLWHFDLIAVHPEEPGLMLLQVSTGDHHATRRMKVLSSDVFPALKASGTRLVILTWSLRAVEGRRRKEWVRRWEDL